MAGWDVAILPFAHNESTRFISPTKTPEYLAAGKACCLDIDHGRRPTVRNSKDWFASPMTPEEFVNAIEQALTIDAHDADWKARVDVCSLAEFMGSHS